MLRRRRGRMEEEKQEHMVGLRDELIRLGNSTPMLVQRSVLVGFAVLLILCWPFLLGFTISKWL
jgi:hypothetical protein